jgi:chemotaxis family two-component system sensor kinase Cph1
MLATICRSAERLQDLIGDLVTYARIEATAIHKSRVELNSVISDARKALTAEQDNRNIVWRIDDLPVVLADVSLLQIVFTNLLSNALKFTRGRADGVIEISAGRTTGGTTLCVRDNGIGFNMRDAGMLFDVFTGVHRARGYEGTGLGLAAVQRIITGHGGTVWAESEIEHWAAFYFSLPDHE